MPSASIMPLLIWGACSLAVLYAIDYLLTRQFGKTPQDPTKSAVKDALFAAAYSATPALFAVILWLSTRTFEILIITQIITAISCGGALWYCARTIFSRALPQFSRVLLVATAVIGALCCVFLTNQAYHYALRFSNQCALPVMYYPSPVLALFPALGDAEDGSSGIVVPQGDTTMTFDGNAVTSATPDMLTVIIDKNCESDVLNVKIRIRF